MKFAGAYVPIEKPDKPRVRAVFDRHNGGPSDEYAEVFTAAVVLWIVIAGAYYLSMVGGSL